MINITYASIMIAELISDASVVAIIPSFPPGEEGSQNALYCPAMIFGVISPM